MRILTSIKPTQNQLTVMALIAASKEKPARAAQVVSMGTNMVAARNMLMKLGLIVYTPSHAALTDSGTQLAVDYDIIDDSGTLTDSGNALTAKVPGQIAKQTPQIPEPQLPTDQDMDLGSEPGMESFSPLFRSILLG